MRKLFTPTKNKTKAQAMIEFALVLPILMMLIYGLMEVGRLLFIYASTISAARQAARYGAATGNNLDGTPYYQDCTGIEQSARQLGFITEFNVSITYDAGLSNIDGAPVALAPADPACGDFTTAQNGDRIIVEVETQWVPATPLVPLRPFTIRSRSERTILASVSIAVTGVPEDWSGTGGAPSLTITSDPTVYTKVGDIIEYTYTITNIGAGDLSGPFNVTDPDGKVTITCPATQPTVLPSNGVFICTGTYTVTQVDLDAGTLSVTGVGEPLDVQSIRTFTIPAIQNGSLQLTKASSVKATITGVTYTYTLLNTGNVTLSGSGESLYYIKDDKLGTICTGGGRSNPDNGASALLPSQIAPGQSITCTKTYPQVSDTELNAGSITNVGTATAYYQKYDLETGNKVLTEVQATDEVTVYTTPIFLEIVGELEASPPYSYADQRIKYTFSVQNISPDPVDLTGITIQAFNGHGDPPTVTCTGEILSGATRTCEVVYYAVTQEDLDNVNSLTGVAEPINISLAAKADQGAITFTATRLDYPVALIRSPKITLAASTTITTSINGVNTTTSDPAVTSIVGSIVSYVYTITNAGNVTLQPPTGGFTVTDTQIINEIICDSPDAPIPPSGTKVCTADREVLQEDVNNGSILGTTESSATFGNSTYSAAAKSLTITWTEARLTLEITTPRSSVYGPGVTITYTYTLTNTGNADLTTTLDSDPYDFETTYLKGSTPACEVGTLAIGESTTCSGNYTTTNADMGTDVISSTSAFAYTAGNVPVQSNTATIGVLVGTPTTCNVFHGGLKTETINGVPTIGMTITNSNEYSIDISSITIYYNDAPASQQITELTLGTRNVLWAKNNQSMDGSFTFDINAFTGIYTIQGETSDIKLYVSEWKTGYVSNNLERIVVSFTNPECGELDSKIIKDPPLVDLAITKTDGLSTVDANGTTTYIVRVTNNGPSTVSGAKLSDPIAAGLSKTSIACTNELNNTCDSAPAKNQLEAGTLVLPPLVSTDFYEIAIQAKVTAPAGSIVTNMASVALPLGFKDPNETNNQASDSPADLVVNPNADLAVTKTVSPATAPAGGNAIFTITVTNNGPTPLSSAKLTDPAVSGLAKVSVVCATSVSPNKCVSAPTVSQLQSGTTLPTLGVGDKYAIVLTTLVDAGATTGTILKNKATSSSAYDPTAGNNSGTASVTVTAPTYTDLGVTKTSSIGASSIDPNTALTYTVVINNYGPSSANSSIFKDTPNNVTLNSIACVAANGAACPSALNGVNDITDIQTGVTIETLPSGGKLTFTIGATSGTGLLMSNNASITAVGVIDNDAYGGTNSASAANSINALKANLKIVKTSSVTHYPAGPATFTYVVTVSNQSATNVTGAIVSDAKPSLIQKWTWTCSASNRAGADCTDGAADSTSNFTDVINLNGGESVVYNVTATAVTVPSGHLINTASVNAPSYDDDDESDNSDSEDDYPTCSASGGNLVISAITNTSSTDKKASFSLTNSTGETLQIETIKVTFDGSGNKLDGISYTNPNSTLTTGTNKASGYTYIAADHPLDTVTINSGASASVFTLTFGKTNATVIQVDMTFKMNGVSLSSCNRTASTSTAPGAYADLGVTITDNVTTVTSGGSVQYVVVVTNHGPDAANNATFKDTPTGVTLGTVTCATSGTAGTQCPTSYTASAIQTGVTIPALPSGGIVTFTINGTAGSSSSMSNLVEVAAPSGVIDNNSSSGPDSATDTDTVTTPTYYADLGVTKTDNVTSVAAGGSVQYVVVVTNYGPNAANNATFKDTPTGVTLGTVTCAVSGTAGTQCPTSYTASALQTGVTIPTLPSGGVVTFTINATAGSGTSMSNKVEVAPPAGVTDNNNHTPPGPDNATDTDTVTTPTCTLALAPTTSLTGTSLQWKITNSTGSAVTLTKVSLDWDGSSTKRLKTIVYGTTSIFDGNLNATTYNTTGSWSVATGDTYLNITFGASSTVSDLTLTFASPCPSLSNP